MLVITGLLILIQDDRRICIILAGTVDPHVALRACLAAVFRDFNGRLISLQHMKSKQLFMKVFVKSAKVSFRTLDGP